MVVSGEVFPESEMNNGGEKVGWAMCGEEKEEDGSRC